MVVGAGGMGRTTRLALAITLMIGVAPVLLGGRGPAPTVSPETAGDSHLPGRMSGLVGAGSSDRLEGTVDLTERIGKPNLFTSGIVASETPDDSLLTSPLSPTDRAQPKMLLPREASSWEKLCLLFR